MTNQNYMIVRGTGKRFVAAPGKLLGAMCVECEEVVYEFQQMLKHTCGSARREQRSESSHAECEQAEGQQSISDAISEAYSYHPDPDLQV